MMDESIVVKTNADSSEFLLNLEGKPTVSFFWINDECFLLDLAAHRPAIGGITLTQAKALRDWLGKFISRVDPDMKRWEALIAIPWELRTREHQNELDCLSLKFSE